MSSLVARLKALWAKRPWKPAETKTYIPLTVAVGKVGNGVGLVFDLGEQEMVVVLPRTNAAQLVDVMLDALGLEEGESEPEPRAS